MTRLAEILHLGDFDPMTRSDDRYRASRNVTLVGAIVNSVLSILKVAMGLTANSYALVADGVHSASDLLTDGVVWFAAKQAHRAPDPSHPYGHGRTETGMALALGLILIATALGIVYSSSARLQATDAVSPSAIAIWIALLSVAANEGLYFYTTRVADQVNSKLLRANAWHHRTDSISSVVVMAGVAGSLLGFPFLDAVAAVCVAMMIAKVGWDIGWESVKELMDTSLEEGRVVDIGKVILGVEGVKDLHMLRTRHAGAYALVDVHVIVDPRITVSEGHRIAERIRDRVIHSVDEVADVLVHIDSEDDRGALMGRHLPLRDEFLRVVRQAIVGRPGADTVSDIRLHYRRDEITVELLCPLADLMPQEAAERAARLVAIVRDLPHVADVSVHYTV